MNNLQYQNKPVVEYPTPSEHAKVAISQRVISDDPYYEVEYEARTSNEKDCAKVVYHLASQYDRWLSENEAFRVRYMRENNGKEPRLEFYPHFKTKTRLLNGGRKYAYRFNPNLPNPVWWEPIFEPSENQRTTISSKNPSLLEPQAPETNETNRNTNKKGEVK